MSEIKKRYVRAKVDYFNIAAGDLCVVVDDKTDGIFIKVVKVGMDQVHYLYNFEFEDTNPTKECVWKAALKPLAQFLAATKSVSAGRTYNDILLEIDGGEMPHPDEYAKRGDLAPTIFFNEFLKLVGTLDVELFDDMVDALLDEETKLFQHSQDLYVHSFYIFKYSELHAITENWASFKDVVTGAHNLTAEG